VRAAATARPDNHVHDAWVEAEIDKAWMVAYRLVPGQFGQPVVAEIRVFPREGAEGRPAGEWSAEALGVYANSPKGGITAELIRKVPVAEHRQVGREFAEWLSRIAPDRAPKFTINVPRSVKKPTSGAVNAKLTRAKLKAVLPAQRHKRGRPPIHDEQFFAGLARDYALRVAEGSPHPTKDLAEGRGVSRVRMRALLNETRKRKFLSGTGRGRSGGTITNRAGGFLTE
jgi:hypothetical protein